MLTMSSIELSGFQLDRHTFRSWAIIERRMRRRSKVGGSAVSLRGLMDSKSSHQEKKLYSTEVKEGFDILDQKCTLPSTLSQRCDNSSHPSRVSHNYVSSRREPDQTDLRRRSANRCACREGTRDLDGE